MIVDKEPLGMRGELQETLSFLKTHGTTLVLGLRDVMDSPSPAPGGVGPATMFCGELRHVLRFDLGLWPG